MTRIFGLTAYGLEAVSTQEIAALPGVTVTETEYRRINARCDEDALPALLNLRTLDDVYLEIAVWGNLGHTRDGLQTLRESSQRLDLASGAAICASIRPIAPEPQFSVTASFVGKRNYNTDEIKIAVAASITAQHGWRYTTDDREADFNIRVFIEHQTAYIGLRLGKHPLHERDYQRIERPGALKPSVAAAMLHLALVQPGMTLLDPCCGTGTILIEGAQTGANARGGDIDAEAVSAARTNSTAAGVQANIEEWDARVLPLPDHSIDRIVTNLPWGKQIVVNDELASFYEGVCQQMERILSPAGYLAVLTSLPQLLHFTKLRPEQTIEISLFGRRPTIAVFSAIP